MARKEFEEILKLWIDQIEGEAIQHVISRYFYSMDSRNFKLLKTCFTQNAKAEYDGGRKVFLGRDSIVKGLRGIKRFKYSHHLIGNMMVEIEGVVAKTDTYVVAFLLLDKKNTPARIIVRGLRYLDNLSKTKEGWQINHRIHIPLWQYELDAVKPEFMLSK
jgi:hypothetical protein